MAPETKLVTFVAAGDFTGYPSGAKVEFRKGVESVPVPADYVALLQTKPGHVRRGSIKKVLP